MSFTTAASLGCRFATSSRAIVDQGKVRGGEWVGVYGCGGIGLSAVMIASALGANVVAVDVTAPKLEVARALGATAVVDARGTADVAAAVRDLTGGGAHVSIDALGHSETCANSISSLRRRGRHVQVGLMHGDHSAPRIPMPRVIAQELEIYGSHGMQAWRYGAMMEMILSGRVSPERLVGDRITLDEAVAALMSMDGSAATGMAIVDRLS